MIEIGLFFAAGFLVAVLIALFTVPFLTGRAARNSARMVRAKMPFSAAEMTAEKDQLKAEHAVALRKVEIQLEKQSDKVSIQRIELNEALKKLEAANKVNKAGKLALDEMRAREHDLNERLRQRDAQIAGIDQRTRQIIRENREMRLALRKDGPSEVGNATLPLASNAEGPVPIHAADTETDQLRAELADMRDQQRKAEKTIADLEARLSDALDQAAERRRGTPRLPKARMPADLSKSGAGPHTAMPETADTLALAGLQDKLLDYATEITRLTALVEGEGSPIRDMIAKAPGGTGPVPSLADRMKALIAARHAVRETGSDAASENTASRVVPKDEDGETGEKENLEKSAPAIALPKITGITEIKEDNPAPLKTV